MNQVRLFFLVACITTTTVASETVTTEPGGQSYNFVASYEVTINASPEQIWPHLKYLKGWMYDFELAHDSGPVGRVGEVLRLYPNQEFFVQIIEAVPNELLVFANLPSDFRGEQSTGIGAVSLVQLEQETHVRLIMSRRYSANDPSNQTQKETRQSEAFQQSSRDLWDRFLQKLKTNSETETKTGQGRDSKLL